MVLLGEDDQVGKISKKKVAKVMAANLSCGFIDKSSGFGSNKN